MPLITLISFLVIEFMLHFNQLLLGFVAFTQGTLCFRLELHQLVLKISLLSLKLSAQLI